MQFTAKEQKLIKAKAMQKCIDEIAKEYLDLNKKEILEKITQKLEKDTLLIDSIYKTLKEGIESDLEATVGFSNYEKIQDTIYDSIDVWKELKDFDFKSTITKTIQSEEFNVLLKDKILQTVEDNDLDELLNETDVKKLITKTLLSSFK